MAIFVAAFLLAQHRVPDGFTIEKIADASFPMFAAFDDRGRLFITESSGGDLYLELQQLVRKCKVRLFDARFETSRVFAEGLTPSMGLVWRGNKLYVADPPDLVTLEDTDGDGKADKRTVILTGFGHQDNGSLHGLVFGPDGLLYMTTGEPDGYKLKRRDGSTLEGVSGALIRCKPDGSDPEVLARGFENLIEVVFLPTGEIIGTCNWFQKPSSGLRDALVHITEGGLYPYAPDVGTPHPVTGDPLPPLSLFPAVALSGLAIHRGDLYSAHHNSRKVQRHVLSRSGSTFASVDTDFVTSDDPDFHPSDVLEAPDGSLIVVDTGGWYVQHCPTGKIRNSRSPGGIYRVRSTLPAPAPRDLGAPGAVPKSLPAIWKALEGETDRHLEHALIYAAHRVADQAALESALRHDNPRVQKAALILLAQRGVSHEPVLARVTSTDAELRRAALRILQGRRDWAPHATALLDGWLAKPTLSDEDKRGLRSTILAFQSDKDVQRKIGEAAATGSDERRVFLLETIGQTSLPDLPRSWRDALAQAIERGSAQAVRTAATLQIRSLDDALARLAEKTDAPAEVRVEAMRAVIARRPVLSAAAFELLLVRLAERGDPLARLSAAQLLGRARLTDAQREKMREAAGDDPLVSPPPADPAKAAEKLAKFEPLLSGGEAARGRAVFVGAKVACASCHRIGAEGGLVGPDLTKVGAIRSGRDLLESILVPSSTFAQGYENYVAATNDGDVVSGMIARQDADVLVLRDPGGGETRLRKDRIRDLKRSALSVMPEGLERSLTLDEFRDLLAFLRGLQ